MIAAATEWHQSRVMKAGIIAALEGMKERYLIDGSLPDDPTLARLVVEVAQSEKVVEQMLYSSGDFFVHGDGHLEVPSLDPVKELTAAFQSARSQALLPGGGGE